MKKNQKYIVRTNRAGVFYGEIESKTKDSIIMNNVQKIWYWDGACAVEELALNGTTLPENCKITVIIPTMEIAEPIQVIPCTKESINSLNSIKLWKKQ